MRLVIGIININGKFMPILNDAFVITATTEGHIYGLNIDIDCVKRSWLTVY